MLSRLAFNRGLASNASRIQAVFFARHSSNVPVDTTSVRPADEGYWAPKCSLIVNEFEDKSIKITKKYADIPPPPKEGPERDLKNFPMLPQPLYTSPVRHKWIPESWFTIFYDKTGYTGPYMFWFGFIMFLVSKEWFVLEHNFYEGIAIWIVLIGGTKMIGPALGKYLVRYVEEYEYEHKSTMKHNLAVHQDEINNLKDALTRLDSHHIIADAKKENLGLQLEAEYRKRVNTVYAAVKSRLDYQIEKQNARRRLEQKHMSEWIIGNVYKSITAQQEKDALAKCIGDLKLLAAKA